MNYAKVLHEMPPAKRLRLCRTLALQNFTIPISACANFSIQSDTTKYFVDLDRVLRESLEIIDDEMLNEPDFAGEFRRSPLVFSRLVRGGKTTVLRSLFSLLKQNGYLAIIISFNGMSGFAPLPDESKKESILRVICSQLLDPSTFTPDELKRMTFDETILDNYIAAQSRYGTLSQQRFVLLIDELSALGSPLAGDASKMLQQLFLKKNRYLIFTTHIPISIFSTSSDIRVVQMPVSNDIGELRKMKGCRALTGHAATIYGGIPSLIYSATKYTMFHSARYSEASKLYADLYPHSATNIDNEIVFVKHFANEVLTGTKDFGGTQQRFFDRFSSIPTAATIRWPLCYLSKILATLCDRCGADFQFATGSVVSQISYLSTYETPVFSGIVETGLDWQSVVDVAVLLHALNALVNKTAHPLISTKNNRVEIVRIDFVTIPDNCHTLEEAKEFIEEECTKHQPGTLIVLRSAYAKFPLFDGFVTLALRGEMLETNGYQVKLGRRTPRTDVPTDWITNGYVIRGLASQSSSSTAALVRPNGWTYFTQGDIESFLGYSLAPLYPSSWISILPEAEKFD